MITCTIENGFPRCQEINEYYFGPGSTDRLTIVYRDLAAWFAHDKRYLVGRGGHHVFLHDLDLDRRCLIITFPREEEEVDNEDQV